MFKIIQLKFAMKILKSFKKILTNFMVRDAVDFQADTARTELQWGLRQVSCLYSIAHCRGAYAN